MNQPAMTSTTRPTTAAATRSATRRLPVALGCLRLTDVDIARGPAYIPGLAAGRYHSGRHMMATSAHVLSRMHYATGEMPIAAVCHVVHDVPRSAWQAGRDAVAWQGDRGPVGELQRSGQAPPQRS